MKPRNVVKWIPLNRCQSSEVKILRINSQKSSAACGCRPLMRENTASGHLQTSLKISTAKYHPPLYYPLVCKINPRLSGLSWLDHLRRQGFESTPTVKKPKQFQKRHWDCWSLLPGGYVRSDISLVGVNVHPVLDLLISLKNPPNVDVYFTTASRVFSFFRRVVSSTFLPSEWNSFFQKK